MDIQKFVDYLNYLLETDQKALQTLIDFRVPCKLEGFQNTIYTTLNNEIGMLGVLNGIICTYTTSDKKRIVAHYREDKTLFKFSIQDFPLFGVLNSTVE